MVTKAMNEKITEILTETGKVIRGKEAVIERILMAILAEGNILLEDVPGVGKTTLALAFSKALGLPYRRIQFTRRISPVLPCMIGEAENFAIRRGRYCSVACCWQTRSTGPRARPRPHFWK